MTSMRQTRPPTGPTAASLRIERGRLSEWRVCLPGEFHKRREGKGLGVRVQASSAHFAACMWGREALNEEGDYARVSVSRVGGKAREFEVVAVRRTKRELGPLTAGDPGRCVTLHAGDLICVAQEVQG